MKINISRQNIYALVVSLFLLTFVLLFSFLLLIPEGQKYRIQRTKLKIIAKEVQKLKDFNIETLELLKELQGDNRHIITALGSKFSKEKFYKQHAKYFSSLDIQKQVQSANEGKFITYDINTTSKINSPKSFYGFLDALNKSDWVIGINFPIEFKREGEMIRSSFSMKVYNNPKDSNFTK